MFFLLHQMYDDYEAAQEAYAAEPYTLGNPSRAMGFDVGEEYPEEYDFGDY